jgi:hypothetical protein
MPGGADRQRETARCPQIGEECHIPIRRAGAGQPVAGAFPTRMRHFLWPKRVVLRQDQSGSSIGSNRSGKVRNKNQCRGGKNIMHIGRTLVHGLAAASIGILYAIAGAA